MVYDKTNALRESGGLWGVFGDIPAVWAWTVSISVHVVVLGGFCLLQFSQPKVRAGSRAIPTTNVSKVRQLLQAEPITPKPSIKRRVEAGANEAAVIDAAAIFGRSGRSDVGDAGISESKVGGEEVSPRPEYVVPHRVEFFGNRAQERKICYLVDCSGSMQGMFGRVREELRKSIEALEPDQYFYVIFFGGGLFESGDGTLVRATLQAKAAATEFIDSVEPAGATNAAGALARAMRITDGYGDYPTLIYLLTDGFDLTAAASESLSGQIGNMLMKFAPTTRISTIGFWPREADSKILEEISRLTGGEFVSFGDKVQAGGDVPAEPEGIDFIRDMVVDDE